MAPNDTDTLNIQGYPVTVEKIEKYGEEWYCRSQPTLKVNHNDI